MTTHRPGLLFTVKRSCNQAVLEDRARRPEPPNDRRLGSRHRAGTTPTPPRPARGVALCCVRNRSSRLQLRSTPLPRALREPLPNPETGLNGSDVGRTFRKHVAPRSSAKHELRLATRPAAHQHRTDPNLSIIYRLARGSKSVIYSQTLTCTVSCT